MALPVKLGITFTQAEVDAMKAGVQVVIDTIATKIILNLSTQERKDLSKVGPERLPYVLQSVSNLAVDFPQFNPLAYDATDAKNDMSTFGDMGQVLVTLTEATERAQELQMAAGHFAYLFMRKQYELAESNKDQNVPGAQTVYDALKDCFEGQGDSNDDNDDTNP